MFIKLANRRYVKNCLLIANIALSAIFICLLVFGLTVIRPKTVAQATAAAQYYLLDLNHLPQGLDTVEPDYIGHENNSTTKEFDGESVASNQTNIIDSTDNETPKIVILVANLGLSKKINELALKLPPQISLGVIPYSNSLQAFINEAQGRGHEIYTSLPNFVVAGGEDQHREENNHKFNDWLNMYGKYKGVYSGHTINNENSHNFHSLLKQIEDKNLLLILGSVADATAIAISPSHKNIIRPHVIIGLEADEDEINKNLEQLIKQAKADKKAIGYANGYLLTIELIHKWLPTIKSQGIELVPISSAVGW